MLFFFLSVHDNGRCLVGQHDICFFFLSLFFSHGETGALVKDISAWQKHILKVPMSEEREFPPSDGEEKVPNHFKHGLK